MLMFPVRQGYSRQVNTITTHKFFYSSVCLILVRVELLSHVTDESVHCGCYYVMAGQ
jgi:hypothetical protein